MAKFFFLAARNSAPRDAEANWRGGGGGARRIILTLMVVIGGMSIFLCNFALGITSDRTMKDVDNVDDNALALLARARAWCAAAEQCSSAAADKLRTWGADADVAADIVARLVDEGYIDDDRYASAYCESKMLRAGWGRLKVLHQLRLKHLPHEVVTKAIAAVDDEVYMARLEETARKKAQSLNTTDPATLRHKVTAFLAQRGYTLDEINETLTNIKQKL